MIVNALDPDRVYIGGELTLAWDVIADTVRSALSERVLTQAATRVELLVVPPQESPRLLGAAALVAAPAFSSTGVA